MIINNFYTHTAPKTIPVQPKIPHENGVSFCLEQTFYCPNKKRLIWHYLTLKTEEAVFLSHKAKIL